jgi:hypothetical protein
VTARRHAGAVAHSAAASDARPSGAWRDVALASVVVAWIAAGLALDAGAALPAQRAIGAVTWLILLVLLRRERAADRWQVAAAVVIATAGEYVLSAVLGLYRYRLGNLPAFVPPGHGLVYLAAIALGRSRLFARHGRAVLCAALSLGGAWAIHGVTAAARPDALGVLLFVTFALFAVAGRAPLVYAAAFLLTTYLELVGTAVGNWRWAHGTAGGLLSIGNPPSGVPGVYCVLDALALAAGPAAWRAWERCRPRVASPERGEAAA